MGNLLTEVDEDGSGTISEEEVTKALSNKEFNLMTKLQALDIAMDMEDFQAMIKRLKQAREAEEVPIVDIVESLKHLSGTATASSLWDLKMMFIAIQNEFFGVNVKLSQDIQELHRIHLEMHDNHVEHGKNINHITSKL